MQFNQPFWSIGYHNKVYLTPDQNQSFHYPEVIGEGDVLSVTLPDGSVQYYFVPGQSHRIFYPINSNIPNAMQSWPRVNNEAWIVRNTFDTHPIAGPSQEISNYIGSPVGRQHVNYNFPSIQGYVQKFHNDRSTSTTDLQYFCPRLNHEWLPKGCMAVHIKSPQKEQSIFHCENICNRTCWCIPKTDGTKKDTSEDENTKASPMSVDEIKPENVVECCCYEPSNKKKKSCQKVLINENKIQSCSCQKEYKNTSDKSVSTYTDKAINCRVIERSGRRQRMKNKNIPSYYYPECDSSCSCTDSDEMDNR